MKRVCPDDETSSDSDESPKTSSPPSTASNSACPSGCVILTAEGVNFTVSRRLLADNSEYFNVMFNGRFIEANQERISLQTVTASAMKCVLAFIRSCIFDMPDLNTIGDFFHAANYFGIRRLYEKLEDRLINLLDDNTCFKIFNICNDNYVVNVLPIVKSYILYSFQNIKDKICDISNIKSLHWYLSHENLNVESELDVFNVGCKWLAERSTSENDILVLLSCLIFKNISNSLEEILSNNFIANNEVAQQVINAIIYVYHTLKIDKINETEHKMLMVTRFNETTYDIVNGLLSSKNQRIPPLIPCILKKSEEVINICQYDTARNNVVPFLPPIPGGPWWGQNVVSWKGFNIFVVCGKIKVGDIWNHNVYYYNCIKKRWILMVSSNPLPRRHATAVVNDDKIYLIGGYGQYRIVLKSVQVYNITEDTWSDFPDYPEYTTSIVACFHKGKLFVSGDNIYMFDNDRWNLLGPCRLRHSALLYYNDHIFFSEKWTTKLNYWDCSKSPMDSRLLQQPKLFKNTHYYVAAMCVIGDIIYIFSEGDNIDNVIAVELYKFNGEENDMTKLLWFNNNTLDTYISYCCFVLANPDIVDSFINDYGKRWLS